MDAFGFGLQGQIFGGLLSAIGAYQKTAGDARQLRNSAATDTLNASLAEQSAQSAFAAGQMAEQRSRITTANLKATQITGLAANGIDIGEGSAARTLASTDIMGQIDANTIAANAISSGWGYRTQAANFESNAAAKRSAAGALSPLSAAATSLLGSASQVADTWYKNKRAGGEAAKTAAVPAPDYSGTYGTPQAGA